MARVRGRTAGACAKPNRGCRARRRPCACGDERGSPDGRTAKRGDRSWLQDKLATGRGRREALADREGRRGYAGNDLGEELPSAFTARRIEGAGVGAEDDVDSTYLESLFVNLNQQPPPSIERSNSGTVQSFVAFLASRSRFLGVSFPGEPTTTLFCARRRGAWHFAPRLRGTRAWRPRVRRDRRVVTSRVYANLVGANQSSSDRRRRSSRSTTPTPRSRPAPSVSATRHLDVRSKPRERARPRVHRRSRARARACIFVAGKNSPTWARTSSRGRRGTRVRPGSAPRAPPTSRRRDEKWR